VAEALVCAETRVPVQVCMPVGVRGCGCKALVVGVMCVCVSGCVLVYVRMHVHLFVQMGGWVGGVPVL
jgi:hypothetical protein